MEKYFSTKPGIQNSDSWLDFVLKDRKRFATWMWVKRDIHGSNHTPPLFKDGEVWWCYTGENVGFEINGKGGKFTRPILILKKYDRYSFLGLPLSTKIKDGSWYIRVIFGGISHTINLAQGRTFDYRRLKEKMGDLGMNVLQQARYAFVMLHSDLIKIDLPPSPVGVVGNPK